MTTLTRRESGPRSFLSRNPFGFMRDEFDNFLTRFGDWDNQWVNQFATPSLDVAETESAVDVTMDIPGMKADDIDLQVTGNLLTISGQRSEETETKGNGKSFHRIERHMGSFSRSVTLPCDVDESKVDATYQNGVLKVSMPKTEAAKAHKIKVLEKK